MARVVVFGSYAPSIVNFRGALIQDLIAAGHDVIACAAGDDGDVRAKLADWGAEYRSIPLARTGMNPLQDARAIVELVRLWRQLSPDVLLSYTIKPVIYGSLAAKIAGVPQINSMITGLGYAFMGRNKKQRLVGWLAQRLYRAALAVNHRTFFQNDDDAELFLSLGLCKQNQIELTAGSGVDLEHFAAAELPSGAPTFLMCARILEEKGVREYYRAAAEVKREFPAARFLYLGPFDRDNPSAIDIAELERLNHAGQVEYLGETKDVRPFIRQASVCVLPSYREGTPRTMLEAAAMARPLITSAGAGGCAQTVNPGVSGFLVPVGDVAALAQAMREFLLHPETIEPMGQAGRAHMANFEVHRVNAKMIAAMGLQC